MQIKTPMKDRLKELCKERGLNYDLIVSKRRGKILTTHRRHLVLTMREEFPHITTTRLAQVFNMNHSSIVLVSQKAKRERDAGQYRIPNS